MTHVLWVLGNVEFDGGTHFHILPKARSNSGQKRSNFETQKFIFKAYLSCPVLPQGSKNVIYFDVRQLEIRVPKIVVQKSDVIMFTWFLGHCTARNKDIGLKFCTLVVGIKFYNIYSVFWIS